MAKFVTEKDFTEEVLNSNLPVMVDFFATWCGPCKAMAPSLEEISSDMEGKAKVLKIDIDQASELTNRFNVKMVPTILYFKDGNVVDQVVGAYPKEILMQKLKPLV